MYPGTLFQGIQCVARNSVPGYKKALPEGIGRACDQMVLPCSPEKHLGFPASMAVG